ncbi:Tripartite tricarboxylate transporter family receptor [Xylophilus ampelinus]|uniref:Tripartite tricarboxylate transporter substrate binding protein n=1 Tax=Variovorax paradoxus TaxID=34073 RepID=A0A2W5SUL7_VARPD|nr:MAG: hypothetical protein DI563_00345 [Variovorax paradoxus]VTY39061.1 Tripartite tricarboxylate transporter family receptor [Xylophilus ampelinus]
MTLQKLSRRLFTAGILAFSSMAALAQGVWPNKPVRLVIGIPPGLAADVFARVYAEKLSKALGQPVVVDNKLGATGNIAQDVVAKAPGDGYTLLYAVSNSFVINPYIYKKLPYDVDKDFAPVSPTVISGLYLVASKNFPAKTVPEMIKLLRANPGKFSYGSYGVGGYPHMMMELLLDQERLDVVHVPYKAGAMTDVIGGLVPLLMEPPNSAVPFIKEGRVQALAYLGPVRNPATPDVPLLQEFVKDAEINSFHGIWAPAGTPKEIVTRLNLEIAKISRDPEVQEKVRATYAETTSSSPEEMGALVKREQARWSQLVKAKNIQLD